MVTSSLSLTIASFHRQTAMGIWMPEAVPVSHISRAFQAVIRAYLANRHLIQTVFCPGLGTGVGAVPPMEAARAMADVYTQMLSQ
jgi:O-acetyl-ADP-ribose deacetylase (regulator of RNase III)